MLEGDVFEETPADCSFLVAALGGTFRRGASYEVTWSCLALLTIC